MLKTNSKKFRENLRSYIMRNVDTTNYGTDEPKTFEEAARFILDTFKDEKFSTENERRYYRNNERVAFEDWCAGLPSALDTCYYYNRSAVDDLGNLLEQTESERSRYSEEEAETAITRLIYREIKAAV